MFSDGIEVDEMRLVLAGCFLSGITQFVNFATVRYYQICLRRIQIGGEIKDLCALSSFPLPNPQA